MNVNSRVIYSGFSDPLQKNHPPSFLQKQEPPTIIRGVKRGIIF